MHGIVHGTAHPLDIRLLDRTALARHLAFRRDDVVCAATGYATDVGRAVRAHGTEHAHLAHALDGTACGLDGTDALLGSDAGMTCLADEARRKGVVIRGCQAGTADVASIVEDEAGLAGRKARRVEVGGATATGLLLDAEDDLDGGILSTLLDERAHRLDDRRDAYLVITAQHGGAIAVDDPIDDAGLHVLAGLHAVEMRGEDNRSRCGACKLGVEVSRIRTNLGTRAVYRHRAATFLEGGLAVCRRLALAA